MGLNMKLMTILAIILLFSTVNVLYGQSEINNKLHGSWKEAGRSVNKRFTPNSDPEIISFYSDNIYQICKIQTPSDSLHAIAIAGKWKIDLSKNILHFKNNHSISKQEKMTMSDYSQEIISITDSNLVLLEWERDLKIYIHYTKTDAVKQFEDLYQFLAQESNNSSQFTHFTLVNRIDTTRKLLINWKGSLEISLHSDDFDPEVIDQKDVRLFGFPNNITDSSFLFNLVVEEINLRFKDGSSSRTDIDNTSADEPIYRDVNFKNIDFIQYASPFRQTLNSFASATTILSFVTAFLIAPLVSIKYRDGGFNTNRYFRWAGVGLAGLTVGIPLTILAPARTYKLRNPSGQGSLQDYWLIRK